MTNESISQYFSGTFTDATLGYTLLMASVAFSVIIVSLLIFKQAMTNWKEKSDAKLFYLDNVIAFKVGYIQKTAADKGIDLKYRPKSDLMEVLEEEVSNDLNTSS